MIQLSQENFRGKGSDLMYRPSWAGAISSGSPSPNPGSGYAWSAGFDLYNMERWYEDFDSESSGERPLRPSIGEYTKISFGYEYETLIYRCRRGCGH